MMSSSRAKEVVEAQKSRILELCKEAYPDSVSLQEIVMKTNFKLNKIPIDEMIRDGSVEYVDCHQQMTYDGEHVRLNG